MQPSTTQELPISPFRVSGNGRYFVDRAGQPVFWLGDTQWELFRLFEPATAMRILQDRRQKGVNVVLVMLLGVNTAHPSLGATQPHMNLHGQMPWVDQDPLRPNEKYFQHIDRIIGLGVKTGQTLVVGIYHQWQRELISLEKARPWARWVASRYRDVPNLIWCMYPKAEEAFVTVCRELAGGLQEGDGGSHMISMHPDPCVASSSFMHEEPWLAFNMIQTWVTFDRIYDAVAADYSRQPAKPAVMAEGGYEGRQHDRLHTPHDIRKQAFWSQLAGGHHAYGCNDAWAAPGQFEQWLSAPGSGQLRVFKQIITSLDQWWALLPDQSIFAAGAGAGYGLNVAARSPEGKWIAAYLSQPCSVGLRLDALRPGKASSATWIDPRNGQQLRAGTVAGSGTADFTSPAGWEDAFLLIT
jgi:hypothetical protein